jgi:cytochrome c-type biogenesis protein CcmH
MNTEAMASRLWRAVAVLLLAMLFAGPVGAVEPDEILPDRAMEARARALSLELRCLVCQNQSIDDSNAPLARDLRLLVRERLKAGDSDDAVRSFVVARYGEFVLLRPPMNAGTLLLWLGPPAMLLLTLGFLLVKVRRDRLARARRVEPLSAAETARLEALLKDKPGGG